MDAFPRMAATLLSFLDCLGNFLIGHTETNTYYIANKHIRLPHRQISLVGVVTY